MSNLPPEAAASLTMLYSGCSNVYNGASPEQVPFLALHPRNFSILFQCLNGHSCQQADKAVYVAGSMPAAEVSGNTRVPTRGMN